MRRLLLAALVATSAFATAPAGAEPPCYGAYAGDYEVGYCAGIVCTDLCYWQSYPVCEAPDAAGRKVCAIYKALLPPIG